MTQSIVVVLDDRDPPAESVRGAIGAIRYSDIVRQRQTLASELAGVCHAAGATRVDHLTTEEERISLVDRIRDSSNAAIYVRIPLCLPPTKANGLSTLLQKARYALSTMLASPVYDDEAVAVLMHPDAVTLLNVQQGELRRSLLLGLRDRAQSIVDHAGFIDIRVARNLMLYLSGATESRHFNVGYREGQVFCKESCNTEKMRAEHDYFHVAPPELKRFLMSTFGFWSNGRRSGYKMEYWAVPDAALQWAHNAFKPIEFSGLLDQVFDFLAARPSGDTDPEKGRAQILGKLTTRMRGFLATETGRKTDAILAACGPHGSLTGMLARATDLIDLSLKRYSSKPLVFSHGDPCFSNILYDRRTGLFRLIDPRGASKYEDAFMHPLYDVAKVSHSVLGGYDFINNGLFRACLDNGLDLRLDWSRSAPSWATSYFRERVEAEGYNLRDVRSVELSLFLSMLPLHVDRPEKLIGFALIAGSILDELEGSAE